MTGAPTDCRVPATPDPTDAKADGNFGNHRSGYSPDKMERTIATARKGWTLAAGEGAVLVEEIDRLRDQLAVSETLRETQVKELGTHILTLAESLAENGDALAKAKAILAALREPSEAVIEVTWEECPCYSPTEESHVRNAIRAAVETAEQEVDA